MRFSLSWEKFIVLLAPLSEREIVVDTVPSHHHIFHDPAVPAVRLLLKAIVICSRVKAKLVGEHGQRLTLP